MGRLSFERLDRFHVQRLREKVAAEAFGPVFPDAALWERHYGEAALLAGEPVAAGGLVERAPRRLFAWSLLAADFPPTRWPELAARFAAAIERALIEGAERVEAETFADWDQGARLLLSIGLRPEGVLRHALEGRHAMIFARTRREEPLGSLRYEASLDVALRCWDEDVWRRRPTPMRGLAPGKPPDGRRVA